MPEFHFMESEWGTHAKRGGAISTAGALLCMLLGFIFFSVWGAFLALAIGLLLATFETPFVFKFLEPCRRLKDILNETLKFSIPAVRAVIDFCLAVLCFWSGTINILLGILLLLTSILYVFAQIVGATLTDGSSVPSTEGPPAEGQTPFGTFT